MCNTTIGEAVPRPRGRRGSSATCGSQACAGSPVQAPVPGFAQARGHPGRPGANQRLGRDAQSYGGVGVAGLGGRAPRAWRRRMADGVVVRLLKLLTPFHLPLFRFSSSCLFQE